ncbi:MAG: hypothetical protein RLZZ41_782 [Actinomycetota bacterium]|jgi:hypothetical protein
MDQQTPTRLIGVYNADGGIVGELKYFFGHLIGVAKCELCDVTHSPIRRKASFDKLAQDLKVEFGLEFALKHLNERTESEIRASSGQEPCVLAQYADGSLGMFLDRAELAVVKGDVAKFEGLVRARLRLFF